MGLGRVVNFVNIIGRFSKMKIENSFFMVIDGDFGKGVLVEKWE